RPDSINRGHTTCINSLRHQLNPLFILHLTIWVFFFNDASTSDIYTLSLHDALPICYGVGGAGHEEQRHRRRSGYPHRDGQDTQRDRKSTRLNSSHSQISYAVFCLKKKKERRLCTTNVRRRYL